MIKRRIGGQTAEVLASKAERVSQAAMAQVEADTQRMRTKTERLRALRLAKEAAEVTKRWKHVPVNQGYDNEEEYIAITLSNIHLAEKGQKLFRGSHDGYTVMQHPEAFLKNAQNVNLSPIKLLEQFRVKQPGFFNALADIPMDRAWWNPVREYREMFRRGAARPVRPRRFFSA